VISGAGPTLMAVCDNAETAQLSTEAMKAIYDDVGIASQVRATCVLQEGANITDLV
jgi:homoserine kinase